MTRKMMMIKKILLMVLMVTFGMNVSWGQAPVEITTDADNSGVIEDTEKKLYLIQTNAFQSFYMAPHYKSNAWTITTNNILGDYMLWYFLDAGKDNAGTENEIQYYYIVSYTENKYICHAGGTANNDTRKVTLVEKSETNDARCKFYLVEDNNNGTTGFYNIDAKGKPSYYGLNKQNGSMANETPIRLTDNTYIHDSNSKWKFIRYNGTYSWPASPFTVSTDLDKHYYKIYNVQNVAYYISTDATPDKVTYASTESNNMVWYLKEAGSDAWFKYYYIVNSAADNKYMYYSGTAIDGSAQTDAVSVKAYNSENENRYQFVVVQAARGNWDVKNNKDTRVECYAIIPKLLCGNLWTSNSIGSNSISDGANMGIISSRSADNNAHWKFESTGAWADPGINCDETGTVTITCEAGAEVYYTTNGDTPTATESATNKEYNAPFTVNTGKTTINARVIKSGKDNSNVVAKTIVFNPTITLTAESYIYTGSAQNPVSSVDYVDEGNSENNIHFETTQYTISYKKGTTAVENCTDAGEYTIILNDVDGDDYIVRGTRDFTIEKAALSATVSLDDWAYGETAATPSVTGNTGNGAVTYTYKVKDATDDAYISYTTEIKPNAGDYTLKASIAATTNYLGGEATTDFTIVQKSLGDGTVPATGITIDVTKTGDDYIVSVKNSGNDLSTDDYDVTEPGAEDYPMVWTITGKRNYKGGAVVTHETITFWKTEETAPGMEDVATYISKDVNKVTPSGMTAYIVTGINMTKHALKLKPISDIPQNVPVLLLTSLTETDEENEIDFTASPTAGSTSDTDENQLQVSTGQEVEAGQVYAFYKGKFALTTKGTLKVDKFFLDNPTYTEATPGTPMSSAPLRIVFDETTDAEEVKWMMDDGRGDQWYALDGRRLNGRPTKKGLYIRNGHKVVIK